MSRAIAFISSLALAFALPVLRASPASASTPVSLGTFATTLNADVAGLTSVMQIDLCVDPGFFGDADLCSGSRLFSLSAGSGDAGSTFAATNATNPAFAEAAQLLTGGVAHSTTVELSGSGSGLGIPTLGGFAIDSIELVLGNDFHVTPNPSTGRTTGGGTFTVRAFGTPVPWTGAAFRGLGFLPGGASSQAYGVSADGTTVVGQAAAASGNEAFRWTSGGGMQSLGMPDSDARGASADGSVIVGTELGSNPVRAYRWDQGVVTLLAAPPYLDYQGPDFPPLVDPKGSWAYGVSADGMTVVGAGQSNSYFGTDYPYPIAWSGGTFLAPLGTSPDRTLGWAYAASADGSVFVGQARNSAGDFSTFTYAHGLVNVGGGYHDILKAVSADGSVAVGFTNPGGGAKAWRVTIGDGVEILQEAHACCGHDISEATGISADGSVIVGDFGSYIGPTDAMIWTRALGGMDSLRSVLASKYGASLSSAFSGWSQTKATAISGDGRVIVGNGIDPSGHAEGWIVSTPGLVQIDVDPDESPSLVFLDGALPTAVAMLGSQQLDVREIDVTTLSFGPLGAKPSLDLSKPNVYQKSLLDVNGDGFVDLVAFFRARDAGLTTSDTMLCMSGEIAGAAFHSCDDVVIMPGGCGLGAELTGVIPLLMWLHRRRAGTFGGARSAWSRPGRGLGRGPC
jgi:uncharacterized membrane protein